MRPLTSSSSPTRARASFRASRRRWVQYGLLFVTAALVVNALIGDRGFTALVKAKRDYAQLNGTLDALRRENARLQDEVSRLTHDARTIEDAARRDLGLARKDEVLFILRDVRNKP